MTTAAIWAPSGSTSGHVSRLHASADGKRTLCGRVVGDYWNEAASPWEKWVAIDATLRKGRLCERCQQATAAKATR